MIQPGYFSGISIPSQCVFVQAFYNFVGVGFFGLGGHYSMPKRMSQNIKQIFSVTSEFSEVTTSSKLTVARFLMFKNKLMNHFNGAN